MNMLTDLHQFHLLRPQFLWLLLPAALLCWALARTALNGSQLQKVIDPELLPHLILRGGAKRPWLFGLIFALLASAIIALAGPSWRKLPTPVYSNQDALVILLDLSPSMMATDLSPNRLTRARLKILDILRQRKDGLTALVAYAGEAHVVTPLTEDTATIANLVPALTPSIMPVSGSNIEMAVQTGLRLLKDGANGRGQLLAITDDVDRIATAPLARSLAQANVALNILAVGSGEGSPIPRGDTGGFVTDSKGAIIIAKYNARELAKLARDSGGRFAEISVNDSDIARLLPQNEAPEEAQLTEREFDQWREEGPWLILLLLPFAALLFRRGALACALPFSVGALLMLPAQQSKAFEWQDLWRRDDQQARQMLEEGETEKAAKTFRNPQWRGTANYRAGDFPAAAEDFSHSTGAQDLYNLGNSLTQEGRYDEAINAYDEALKQQPQLADAAHNRDIAKKLKELQQQQQQQNQQQSGDSEQQSDNEQQSQDQQQQQDQQQDQQEGEQQNSGSQSDQSQDQQSSDQQPQDGEQKDQEQQQQAEQQQGEEEEQKGQGQQQDQQKEAGAKESPLDPETQQALDQWLRQIPDDPAGLMREKFKYESLQRRRAYRSGDWQPPENGASQRW